MTMMYCATKKEGFSWPKQGIEHMKKRNSILAVVPRVSPPFSHIRDTGDAPSLRFGRWAKPVPGGWKDSWMSTRCFLIDTDRLEKYLPLIGEF